MLKCKNIAKITTAVAIAGLVTFGYDVLAETQEERLQKYEDKCDISTISSKYDLELRKVEAAGNQYIIEVNGEDAGDTEFKVTKIVTGNPASDINSLGIIKKGQPLYLNIDPVGGVVKVEITMKTSDIKAGCLGTDDEEYAKSKNISYHVFFVELEYKSMSAGTGNIYQGDQTIDNPHIGAGKICTNFITGVYDTNQFNGTTVIKKEDFEKYNYAAVSQEGKQYYSELIPYCFNARINKNHVYDDKKLANMIGDAISIWKQYSTPVSGGTASFNETFNAIKNAAIAAGKTTGTVSSPVANGTALNYENKCSTTQTDRASQNYYSAQIVDSQTVQYTYNYAPGDVEKVNKTVCDRICEEAVKVEYGPPVASKAGLCFEYTVKVESYVKCSADIKPNSKPETYDGNYAWPEGACMSQEGKMRSHVRAGPTEDFERCIRKCDGGKYTQKCSLKCYKQVYGNKSNLKISYANTRNNGVTKINYSLSECLRDNPDGCYIRSGSNINWEEDPSTYDRYSSDSLARYYSEPGTEGTSLRVGNYNYIADENGFKRAIYNNGSLCDDICWWIGSSVPKGTYLNPGSGIADDARNIELYNSAVSACKAAATCSKKTATFTIAVKYDTKDGDEPYTVHKVYYPYTSNSQHKSNPTEGGNEYNSIAKDTFTNGIGFKNDSSTIIDFDGCYASTDNNRWYLTEWGFPGTYINNKTGEISFATPDDLSGWYLENKKFCIPLNAKTVNADWWTWKVMNNGVGTAPAVTAKSGTSDGYNIEAIAKDFGYFGWDLTTKCFYAINNQPGGRGGTGGTPDEIEETAGYIIRAVDRGNLFPNSGMNVTEAQRREIGFNWTSKATILSQKNNKYKINPEDLKESIEANADSIYAEDPDYEFTLTPSDLTTLRRYNKKYNYTEWLGDTSSINGVMSYQSNLFRIVGEEPNILDTKAVVTIGSPGVNNE